MRRWLTIGLALALLGPLAGVGAAPAEGLLIFSGRREPLLTPVLELFQQQTGVQATVKFSETSSLANEVLTLQALGRPVPDVFLGDDAGTLEFLRLKADAFEPYTSPQLERIPPRFRAPDGTWLGVSGRARVIIYNRDLVQEEELPSTAFDLIDPRWRGRVATSNGNDTDGFVPWISALRLTLGDELVKAFLQKLKDNGIAILAKQTDVRKAVGRGEFALGLVNSYYVYLQQHEPDPAVGNVGLLYPDQGPFQLGTLVNATAAAIVRGAAHPQAARRFLDFLVSPEAQQLFAKLNFEYPLLPGVATHPQVLADLRRVGDCASEAALDCLRQLGPPPAALGAELENTQRLLHEFSWF